MGIPPLLLAALAGIALVGLATALYASGVHRWLWIPGGLVLGGVVGNAMDRVRHGAVTDFLVIDHHTTNLADIAVIVGMLGALVLSFAQARRPPKPPSR